MSKRIVEKVLLGQNLFQDWITSLPTKPLIIVERKVFSLYRDVLFSRIACDNLAVLDGTEKCKTIDRVQSVWEMLIKRNISRKEQTTIVGGGAFLDMVGFACSNYMRGLSITLAPTTILSMADSAIGGKTGVNYRNIKNLIGSFIDPLIVVDLRFVHTLSRAEVLSGFGEIFKMCILFDGDHLTVWNNALHSYHNTGVMDLQQLEILIRFCIRKKFEVVSKDPYETKGQRQALNLGHTIGHAIESAYLNCGLHIPHGVAVVIGLVIESLCSIRRGILGSSDFQTIVNIVMRHGYFDFIHGDLIEEHLLPHINYDKKFHRGYIYMPLLTGIGSYMLFKVSHKEIQGSLEEFLSLFSQCALQDNHRSFIASSKLAKF